MDKKQYIIIVLVAIIAVLAIAIGYTLLTQSNVEYETIHISNGTTIEVPKASDSEWIKDSSGIRTFTCPSKHTVMNTFNSEEDLSIAGAGGYALARDYLLTGTGDVETYKNFQIKENDINGTHFYIVNIVNDETHDNIIIGSTDLNILKHMLDSLVFGPPAKGESNATVESAPPSTPSTNDDKKYSEDDLKRANEEGYDSGYVDGYDDSYNDYNNDNYYDENDDYNNDNYYDENDDYDYDDSSSDNWENIETTTDDI